MRRFWIKPEFIKNDQIFITGELVNHIVRVCRFSTGSKFEVLCEGQRALLIQITQVSKTQVVAQIISERIVPELAKPHIVLAVSVPKPQKLEMIIQKSVELGVKKVIPFVSDFSFFKSEAKITGNKRKRWDKIVTAATQQSGRGDLMEISEPIHLDKVLEDFNRNSSVRGLFMYEGECELSLRKALQELKQSSFDELWYFVGSEGGFSDAEKTKFTSNDLQPVHLGDQILRVETACLSLASILKYELEDIK